jgi:hypothetical protein
MTETSFAQGPTGKISQNKTIYVQGNKQRIERESIAQITDLDSSLIYIIDKNRRVYSEIPLQALSSAPAEDVDTKAILTKTGETRFIADHPCSEYRAVDGSKLERVTVSACVSTNVPGTKEVSDFNRKMIARLGGHTPESPSRTDQAGLILQKQSVLSFRLPDPARPKAYQMASLIAETRVDNIQLKTLPPQTFTPPVGYAKLPNPDRTAPVDLPDHEA